MRKIIASVLKWQAKLYIAKSNVRIVVVSGSVGKTSTTQAIGTILSQKFSIRKTLYNYNTDLGVPCSIFGRTFPSNVNNPFGWGMIILKNQFSLLGKLPVDLLVLELGTDSIGEIETFKWLQPSIGVVTAIAPEHMEQFGTLEAVAKEELSITHYSDVTFVNKNMVSSTYFNFADTDELFNYERSDVLSLVSSEDLQVTGDHSLDALAAGVAVGKKLGMSQKELIAGLKTVSPVNGRMKKLQGINQTTLIDDTYNASPEAVIAALDYIYGLKAPQKIVLLGNMNELGECSESEHVRIGQYCLPEELDLVVTLGPDANKYIATAAEQAGCSVLRTSTPYESAQIIKEHLKSGAIVLLKGSQNKVFAEEATKLLLKNPLDEKFLVRQSESWLKKKKNNFERSETFKI